MTVVVDASAAAKWFLPEAGTAEAAELLVHPQRLIAPELIRIEVTAALVRAFREKRMSESVARDACAAWEELLVRGIVPLIENDELHETAVSIAFEIRHSLQDCLYLAAATLANAATVVTADKTFAMRGAKAHPDIRLIGQGDVH